MGVRFLLKEEHNMGEAKEIDGVQHEEQCRYDEANSPGIVMHEDRLHETLKSRMESWRALLLVHGKSSQMRKNLLHERLRVCLEIARLIKCLHDEKIICRRALKVENLGFDKHGDIKLVGLGLDKQELKNDKAATLTGSLAFMAPEVANGLKHDRPVDVYSFGFLMWEICALETAFGDRETEDDMHTVWNGDVRHRPTMIDWWPVELQWLIKACWTYFAETRPDLDSIIETLDEILDDENEEEDSIRGIRSFRFEAGNASDGDTSAESYDESARGVTPSGKYMQQAKSKKFFFGLF